MIAQAPTTQIYQQIHPYLFSVAYRMTGSASDAEDLVQDAWIRYLDAGSPAVDSIRAYLTTIVSRLSLDFLKSARVKREQLAGPWMPEPVPTGAALGDPAATIEQRESVSLAFLTLMERLTPEQRVVYVLRQGLGLPYDEIAEHVGKAPAALRQVVHRAQARLDAGQLPTIAPDPEHRALVERFVEVVQSGDAGKIAGILAEDVVLVGDGGASRTAQPRQISGLDKVSRGAAGYARKAVKDMQRLSTMIADVNGAPALVFHHRGKLDRVLALDVRGGKIAGIRFVSNQRKLRHLARSLGLDPNDAGAQESIL